jgi:hypothetical protein
METGSHRSPGEEVSDGPSSFPQRPETPDALPSPILRRLSRPRHALLRGDAANSCSWRPMLACPQGVFGGCAPEGGGAQRAFEPPIPTEGLRWRAFSQFDAYHHVLWTTATSVGQAGASPSQCARGLVTRPKSKARANRRGSPRLLQRYW